MFEGIQKQSDRGDVKSMIYIEACEDWKKTPKQFVLFLAGGITGCPDWQQRMVKLLNDTDYVLLNPRRADFPIHDPDAANEQIIWEYDCLRKADVIQFWFAKETIQPIVLYELGAWAASNKPIFVGIHPEYSRRQDVEIQIKLARPSVKIVYSLRELSQQIKAIYG